MNPPLGPSLPQLGILRGHLGSMQYNLCYTGIVIVFLCNLCSFWISLFLDPRHAYVHVELCHRN